MIRAALLAGLALAIVPATALAQGPGDGAYHRIDRPLKLSLAAGGVWRTDGVDRALGFTADLRARLFDAAGPVVGVRWTPDAHHLMFGVEVRPLFPALFLLDLSSGHAWRDLFLQGLGVEIGAAWILGPSRGVGLAVGLSWTIPLVLPRSGGFGGVGLRLGARRVDATASFQGAPPRDASEWSLSAALEVTLGVPLRAVSNDASR